MRVPASELEAALQRCRDTYRGPGRCLLPEYLAARAAYHKLLIECGALDRKLAQKEPRDGVR